MRNGNESVAQTVWPWAGVGLAVFIGAVDAEIMVGDRHSSHKAVNKPKVDLLKTPEMQAYMAVGGMPAVITLIDNVWE